MGYKLLSERMDSGSKPILPKYIFSRCKLSSIPRLRLIDTILNILLLRNSPKLSFPLYRIKIFTKFQTENELNIYFI